MLKVKKKPSDSADLHHAFPHIWFTPKMNNPGWSEQNLTQESRSLTDKITGIVKSFNLWSGPWIYYLLLSSPFIVEKYLLLLKLSEVLHLLHCWQHTRRGLWHPCPNALTIKEQSLMRRQSRRDQSQTSEFKIDQKPPASTGTMMSCDYNFDLGSSFQWGLTSRGCEESQADSLRRWFQWYSIYKAHGSGSAVTDGAVHSALNYFSQHSWK